MNRTSSKKQIEINDNEILEEFAILSKLSLFEFFSINAGVLISDKISSLATLGLFSLKKFSGVLLSVIVDKIFGFLGDEISIL